MRLRPRASDAPGRRRRSTEAQTDDTVMVSQGEQQDMRSQVSQGTDPLVTEFQDTETAENRDVMMTAADTEVIHNEVIQTGG